MLRDLLVHVTAGDAAAKRVDYALQLAEAFHARLTGVHVVVRPEVPPTFKPSLVDRVAEDLAAREQADAREAHRAFARRTAATGVEAKWLAPEGHMAQEVCALARYADLVIIGHEPTEVSPERNPLPLVDEVVMRCGRPVLVTPNDASPHPPPKRALIAWDGSPQSVRAIHDALPLLRNAQTSLVVVANPEREHLDKDVVDGGALLDHLARHDVAIQPAQTVKLPVSESHVILDVLRAQSADLLVMGAFGHSAFREVLFGGATADLMRETPVPILISH